MLGMNTFLVVESSPQVKGAYATVEEAKDKIKKIPSKSLDSRLVAELNKQGKVIKSPSEIAGTSQDPSCGFNNFWWNLKDAHNMLNACEKYPRKPEGKIIVS